MCSAASEPSLPPTSVRVGVVLCMGQWAGDKMVVSRSTCAGGSSDPGGPSQCGPRASSGKDNGLLPVGSRAGCDEWTAEGSGGRASGAPQAKKVWSSGYLRVCQVSAVCFRSATVWSPWGWSGKAASETC